jgi:hypothetical protein
MKFSLALFLVALIAISCNNTKQITQPTENKVLTLSTITWITDTMRTPSLIFGHVSLFLTGRTTGTKVTVETYGDGVIGNPSLQLDSNSAFSDTVKICFTHWATTDKFVRTTKIRVYNDSIPIDSLFLSSDSIMYYTPSYYSQLEDSIRMYGEIWNNLFLDTYSYRLSRFCECTQNTSGPFTIFVKQSYVDSVYNVATNSAVPDSLISTFNTIQTEFTNLLALVWSSPSTMSITFNHQYGYPTTCLYDPNPQIADDEIQYSIDSLIYSE